MSVKIILAGEGGQGVQTIAKIIAKAAKKSGKSVTYLPSFGVEQRGGVSISFIKIDSNPILYPRFNKASIVVAFSNRSISAIKDYIVDDSILIYDCSEVSQKTLEKIKHQVKNFVSIPAKEIALQKYTSKTSNMLMLGALSDHLKEISINNFENSINQELAEKINKNPDLKDQNLNAFRNGADFASNYNMADGLNGSCKKEIERTFEKGNIKWTRFPEYCKSCALCIVRCPVHALKFSDDLEFLGNPLPIVDMEKCIGCGDCMRICPDAAIKVEKND